MSITSAMYTGVSGLLANAEGLNVIGNNLSNVNTIGFKGSRTIFSDMLSANIGDNSQIGRGTQIQKVDNLFSQGSLETTENVMDLAIQGNSFFALGIPNGNAAVATQSEAYLTRAGAFRIDENYYLVNPDGYQVLDTAGNPIQFTYTDGATAGDFAKITNVDSDGAITYLDVLGDTYYYDTAGAIGTTALTDTNNRIAIISPPNPAGLDKIGGTLYQATNASGVPDTAFSTAANMANGSTEKLFSNSLESSNVDMASEFVKMILTQRAYSANSKTIITADEMTQEVLNLKR